MTDVSNDKKVAGDPDPGPSPYPRRSVSESDAAVAAVAKNDGGGRGQRRSSLQNWNALKAKVIGGGDEENTTKDLWDAIRDAIDGGAEGSGEHRNDKNDARSGLSFRAFRRDLDVLRRSQQASCFGSLGEILDECSDDGESLGEDDVCCDHFNELGDGEWTDRTSFVSSMLSLHSKRGSNTSLHSLGEEGGSDAQGVTFEESSESVSSPTSGGERTRRPPGRNADIKKSIRRPPTASMLLKTSYFANEIDQLARSEAVKSWARSFHRLDPRYQILTYFNDLALEGVEKLESMGGVMLDDQQHQTPLILRVFIRAGVFSVWRPTSKFAIQKMITGEGVGKGLDIKGKSALKGKYSGFVPFLQISKNEDKAKVCAMTRENRVRVFYPNKSSRDEAAKRLKPLKDMMLIRMNECKRILTEAEGTEVKVLSFVMQKSFKSFDAPQKRPSLAEMKGVIATSRRLIDGLVDQEQVGNALTGNKANAMDDPTIYKVDQYAPCQGVYGLDMPEKVFWEGYVARKDIAVEEDSEYDTGRPSIPEFQTMNVQTLRKGKPSSSEPRPVLYHAGCGGNDESTRNSSDPLCPNDLLMAYEEIDGSSGRVTPVVSDFDCFLVGTRGIPFTEPLAERDSAMLTSCVNDIEDILTSPKQGANWTRQWLEVKKKHVRDETSSETPRFGYADPRSYTMMTGAVHRLRANGAVRHGPECFNYSFPQDLDDSFLVVSDELQGNVPWVYVNEKELRDLLSKKIDEGFTFPMNPKWVLCDDGWKELYDKLMASDKPHVSQSMGIWYPDEVRKKIDEISTKFPNGFVYNPGLSSSVFLPPGTTGVDLAELELKRYETTVKVQKKVRSSLVTLGRPARGGERRASVSWGADRSPTFFSVALEALRLGREMDKKGSRTTDGSGEESAVDGEKESVDGSKHSIDEKKDDSQERRSSKSRRRRGSIEKLVNGMKLMKKLSSSGGDAG